MAVEIERDRRTGRFRFERSGLRQGHGAAAIIDPGNKAAEHFKSHHTVHRHAFNFVGHETHHHKHLMLDGGIAQLQRIHLRNTGFRHFGADAVTRQFALRLHAQRLGRFRCQNIGAAGVENEIVRAFAVHHHIAIDVIVDDADRENGLFRIARDGEIGHHHLRRGEIGCIRFGAQICLGQAQRLQIFRAAAFIDHGFARQHQTVHRPIGGITGRDRQGALFFRDARQQMGPGIEPCGENLAVLRCHLQHVIGCAMIGFRAAACDRGAAETWPPPQIGAAIGFVDRNLALVAAGLNGHGARHVLHPGLVAIEAAAAGHRPDAVGIRPGSCFQIGQRVGGAGQALSAIGAVDTERAAMVPGAAATCRLVGGQNLRDGGGGEGGQGGKPGHENGSKQATHDYLP